MSDRAGRLCLVLLGLIMAWGLALRIAYGSAGLDPTRVWDEHYGLDNVRALVVDGQLRPANGFHPGLSYLPWAALLGTVKGLARLTGAHALALVDGPRFTALAYGLCRTLSAVFGVLAILATYLLGRKLADPWVGCLAAYFVSVVPFAIRTAGVYKPDALLLLTMTVAAIAAMRVAESPTVKRYAVAGVAIGVAGATKFNAMPAALPLVVVSLLLYRRERRALWWLVLAGAVALGTFFLLTPYLALDPALYLRDFAKTTIRDYTAKGRKSGMSHADMPIFAITSLSSDLYHGPVLGVVALVGLAALAVHAWLGRTEGATRVKFQALVGYALGYVLLYALVTTNPSPHNWLPLTPVTAFAAAWTLVGLLRLAAGRVPLLARGPVTALAAMTLVMATGWRAHAYCYRELVPSTAGRVSQFLARNLRSPGRQIIYTEDGAPALFLKGTDDRPAAIAVASVAALDPFAVELADGVVYLGDEIRPLPGYDSPRLGGRASAAHTLEIKPAFLRLQGPALVAVARPWRLHASTAPRLRRVPGHARVYSGQMPESVAAGDVVSIEMRPRKWPRETMPKLYLAESQLDLVWVRRRGELGSFVTPRFVNEATLAPLRLELLRGVTLRGAVTLEISTWRAPR